MKIAEARRIHNTAALANRLPNPQAAHEKLLTENEQFRVDTTQLKNDKTAERRAMLGELTNSKSELKVSLIEL